MNFNPAAIHHHLHNNHHHPHQTLSGTKIMEWTNDDALELIEQYRLHTELWNRSDIKYKDKLCRFRAWSEIAERFGCSKAEVERKMNVLLTQYRREKHKMLLKLYQGIQPNPSKWYAFKRFDFMEAGGGSSSSSRREAASLGDGGIPAGGGTNGHTISGLNGLSVSNTSNVSSPATTASAVAAVAAAAVAAGAPSISHYRRMKCKEMKYFNAMGINLPMLIANTQSMEPWNPVGQYSPPMGADRGQLRVPLPMPFHSGQSDLNVSGAATRSLFGGSSNSDATASPQKPMETSDNDEKDESTPKHERTSPASTHDGATGTSGGSGLATGNVVGGGGVITGSINTLGSNMLGGGGGGGGGVSGAGNSVIIDPAHEAGSSPIPNTNAIEAHSGAVKRRLVSRDQDDLDIKQELVDYFHAPHPPAPPDSHRSYSSTDENRLGGGADSDDFAQDLRVSAAAAAAAKNLDFSQFVLPRKMRRSSESIDEKFAPLNMRKLNSSATTATAAGQMLMNSLLSNESLSEEASVSGRIKCGSQDGGASTSAAAAAAALYAESLNKDDCDFIGSNVSLKLRAMDRTQRIIAEKLISEVLYYGQFNELERSAHIQPK